MNKLTSHLFITLVTILLNLSPVYGEIVPQDVKKIISFIYTPSKANEGLYDVNGTGFFMNLTENERTFFYLITAKHVLLNENHEYFRNILIRLNTKDGDSEPIQINIVPDSNLFIHDDAKVDVAVIPLLPNIEKFDFKAIPISMLLTKEQFKRENITEGDDVFFAGLFTPFIGRNKIQPIVRFGKIALLPDEPVPWDNDLIELFLIDSTSFGGNSGSPLFVIQGPTRNPNSISLGSNPLYLAGIVKGTYESATKIKVVDTKKTAVPFENMGISGVVPSYNLYEIIYSQQCIDLRKKGDSHLIEATP